MTIFKFAQEEVSEISKNLESNIKTGLNSSLASDKLKYFGLNKIEGRQNTAWQILWRQFKSAFIYLLIIAMGITFAIGEIIDTILIFSFIVINTGLGFFQEYRSEKTIQLLNKFILPRTKVLRDGKFKQITADNLVPGDIVILETGDKVPADLRIIENHDLIIDETILTGESIPVYKYSEAMAVLPNSYHEANNLVFTGTDVIKGQGRGLVVATGKNTVFGSIAKLTARARKVSDFEKNISKFSSFILKLVALTLILVFVGHALTTKNNLNWTELIIFSVALTVSVIPEALPLVTTFSLARGARRLAKKDVVVKRLTAIEDLGGIEILCSDKTGTLTKNELAIAEYFSDDKDKTLFLANLASSFELKKKIEPFDIALEKNLTSEHKLLIKQASKLKEEPFDPSARYNVVTVKVKDDYYLIMRGAPEVIALNCLDANQNDINKALNWSAEVGKKGERVLALAYKKITSDEAKLSITDIGLNNLNFTGVISFHDPIKPSTLQAVTEAKDLGVKIVIITGDSPEVSGSVAKQIGLSESIDDVITGHDWDQASEIKKLEYLQKYYVFARCSPEQKFDIINTLRQHYSIGFLGEGINDAPALKVSGVSIVVESAADIAREASDIILLKHDLTVITEGIREGRATFINSTKYLKSTLASNFGNFFAIATASLLVDYLPMLPVQILMVNLLTDSPMISISTDTVKNKELVSPRKYQAKNLIIIAIILGVISTVFDFIFFGKFYKYDPAVLQTNWFIGSILTELVLIFSIRTNSVFWKATKPSNSVIVVSVLAVILTLALPFSQFGQKYLHFQAPKVSHLIFIILIVVIYFIISELVKLLYYRKFNKIKLSQI